MHPRYMQTIAEQVGEPGGFPDWDDAQEIASTKLLIVTTNGSTLYYCISPDIQAGELALVYEGDIDPAPCGRALDELFLQRLEW